MPQYKLPNTFKLSTGEELPEAALYYECIGNPNGEIIWVCHALTGHATVKEWWPTIFKENGGYIDLDKHYVICANSLGSCYGSSGPSNENKQFPVINHRDVIQAFHLLKEHLEIPRIDLLIGGSLGGQQALEWSLLYPDEINFVVLIACNAWHSSWGIAWNELQRNAIVLGQNKEGLALARKIAMLSYRSASDFEEKTSKEGSTPSSILPYLTYQGEKFVNRFSAESYLLLSQMMDSHDVRVERSDSVVSVLQSIKVPALVIGIDNDVLFPIAEQSLLAKHIPKAELAVIHSTKGHDAFLLEGNFISRQIEKYLLTIKQIA